MGKSYFVKTPWWLKKLYPKRVWDKDGSDKKIYLSFDDGPEPLVTPFVLDELKKYNAKASFFCIGKNVAEHPSIYQRILDEGHCTGNHTQHHLNGWKTSDNIYLSDITEAAHYIQSNLFRPPYGRIKGSQVKKLRRSFQGQVEIVMWDVLSGDFDDKCSAEKCLENVKKHGQPGSIVVFHDSVKAMEKLRKVLPGTLEHFSSRGYSFHSL